MNEIETIERAGRRWWVRPDAAAPLLAGPWPLDRPESMAVIKRGHRRTVARLVVTDPAGPPAEASAEAGRAPPAAFFVKAYDSGGVLRRLVSWLGLGPGRREWDALLAARRAGLDVPQPVALSCSGGGEVLVAAEVPGAQRLDEYLFERYFDPLPGDPPYPGSRPPELVSIFRRRRRPPEGTIGPRPLARALAELVARLAQADLYLPDLHPGNILISGPPGQWRLTLVDLAEAEQPAPAEALLEHLMRLEHFFEPIASASERVRCLKRLAELSLAAPAARQVAEAAAAYRQRFYRRRDRRTYRESKYFRRLAAGEWRGWATADWAYDVTRLLETYGAGSFPDAEVVKNGRTATVWRVTLKGGRTLFVKRHNRAAGKARARGVVGPSRSVAALRRGHALTGARHRHGPAGGRRRPPPPRQGLRHAPDDGARPWPAAARLARERSGARRPAPHHAAGGLDGPAASRRGVLASRPEGAEHPDCTGVGAGRGRSWWTWTASGAGGASRPGAGCGTSCG